MNKSIETLWKQGFVEDMALIAPQVNDLYNQKSKNLIDRFEYLFSANQRGILIGALVMCVLLSTFGLPVLGLLLTAMLIGLVWLGHQMQKELRSINKDVSSFEYLQAFDNWLEKSINRYVKIYRWFYPFLFLMCAIRFLMSEMGAQTINEFSDTVMVFGVPLLILGFIAAVSFVLGFSAAGLYRADVNLLYGNEIRKLKEILEDMKVLNAEKS